MPVRSVWFSPSVIRWLVLGLQVGCGVLVGFAFGVCLMHMLYGWQL